MSFAKYAQLYRENGFFNGSKIKATITDPDFVGQEMILSKGTTILQTRTIPISMVTEFFTDESGALALSVDNGTKTLSANVNITNYRTYNVTVSGAVQDKTRDIYIDKNNITLNDEVSSDTVKVAWTGDKPTVTVNSSNPIIATATLDNNIVTVADAGNGIKGKTDITIRVASTSAYDEATATVEVNKINGSVDKSWAGLKNIVNEGLEEELCQVGEEYTVNLSTGETLTYIIGAINNDAEHQLIFIPKASSISRRLNTTSSVSASTPWKNTDLRTWLNGDFYNSLPVDLRNVISNRYIETAISATQLDSVNDKIWIPREYEVTGTSTKTYPVEDTASGIHKFKCFDNKLLRSTNEIWCCSMSSSVTTQYVVFRLHSNTNEYVVSGGAITVNYLVYPCFHIIKDSN